MIALGIVITFQILNFFTIGSVMAALVLGVTTSGAMFNEAQRVSFCSWPPYPPSAEQQHNSLAWPPTRAGGMNPLKTRKVLFLYQCHGHPIPVSRTTAQQSGMATLVCCKDRYFRIIGRH
jgi:hypothetical protein